MDKVALPVEGVEDRLADLDEWIGDEIFFRIEGICWASITDDQRWDIRDEIRAAIHRKLLGCYDKGRTDALRSLE